MMEPIEPLMTVNESAQVLSVSRNTAWRFIRSGELIVVEVGGRTLVHPNDLREFVASRRRRRSPLNDDDRAGTRSTVRTSAVSGGGDDSA
jgi:excisionase family DNA binding protein